MPWVSIRADGSVSIHGRDHGTASVVKLNTKELVVRVAGRTEWAEVGRRGYTPATYEIFEVVSRSGRVLEVRQLSDIEVRASTLPVAAIDQMLAHIPEASS